MKNLLQNINSEWINIIYSGKTKIMLDKIINKLSNINNITPQPSDIFNWCRYTKLTDIKVILIGMDPYHKTGWAHGLSFSCNNNSKIPPSLRNIYKCLINTECISEMPSHSNLESWARQGILLLNASLSTLLGKAGAHMKIWDKYVKEIIKQVCDYHYNNDNQLIFMLWGSFAQSFVDIVDDDYHICLTHIHPSPLAQRVPEEQKFINCQHFKEVNQILIEDDQAPIDWNIKEKKHIEEKQYDCAEEILDIGDHHHISFTDGSAYPNNKSKDSRAGYALLFVSGEFKDKCLYGNIDISKYNASNIRAEGIAILRTLEIVKNSTQPWKKLTIITDCEFWMNMIEKYMPKWNKHKFAEKNNPDLTTKLWCVYNETKKHGEIIFMHMKSHNKDGWSKFEDGTFEKFCYDQNDYVDKMCSYARTNMESSEEKFQLVEFDNN